jgi:hypothetical protein
MEEQPKLHVLDERELLNRPTSFARATKPRPRNGSSNATVGGR